MAKKNKKIVKFHRVSQINIGVIIFLIIFIYLLYNVYVYFTTERVAVYEVSQGTIAENNVFTGIILREEKVYRTEESGYINYYNRNATKVGVSSYVYSIDKTGNFYNNIRSQNNGQLFSDKNSYADLEKTASDYVNEYSNQNFYQVYNFQYDMEAELMKALNKTSLSSLESTSDSYQGLHICQAAEPGIVVYNTDGFENLDLENLTKDVFDMSGYHKNNLMTREQVNAEDPAYKMITSEIWSLVIPVEQQYALELEKESNIKVKFKKNGGSAWGVSKILTKDDGSYLVLTFQNSVIRFATERYLEVELLLSDTEGLKIPNTSLTEKSFFLIPKEYLTKDESNSSNGVIRRYKNEDGEIVTEFAPVVVAEETKDMYYVAGDKLSAGDKIQKEKSDDIFPLREQESLQGVYNINRGYAVFRKVKILYQNEEYAIIETGTNYGITLYDHIALEASEITENQIIH